MLADSGSIRLDSNLSKSGGGAGVKKPGRWALHAHAVFQVACNFEVCHAYQPFFYVIFHVLMY